MSIPVFNFKNLHHSDFRKEIIAIFDEIVEQGSFVEGKYNDLFESEFAKRHQVKYCLLVANGTDALEISLKASGVKTGDKVAVPSITFYASAEAILNVGAIPVYIDINPDTGLMDPTSLERMSDQHQLKAVMPVHIYGLPAPMKEIEAIARPKNIAIIEDAAQASGTFVDGKPVGARGNLTTFSFYPTKNLSAFGDAGAVLTNDDELANIIKHIRNHGRGDLPLMGRNSRCDHMQAAVLHLKLKDNEKYNQNRKDIAAKYNALLKELPLKTPANQFVQSSSWHLYPIHLESKEIKQKLQEHLKEKGIGAVPFYDRAITEEDVLKGFSGEDEQAKKMAGTVLCLPMNPFLKEEEISTIATEIKNFFS